MSASKLASILDRPAQYLKGVGPKRARAFDRMGVRTARDLLYHVPRRYEDASTVTPASALEVGMEATVVGRVVSKGVIPTRSGLRIFQAVVRDRSGLIECAWPGQSFLDRQIRKGDLLLVTGPVRFFHGRQLQPREHVVLSERDSGGTDGAVLPIYPATDGLSQGVIRRVMDRNLDLLLDAVESDEPFDERHLGEAGIPPLREALESVHRPESLERVERGRRRLAYGELFFVQLLHARARRHLAEAAPGITLGRTNEHVGPLYRALPFELTGAQTRVLAEILADMTSGRRMSRLLQGDVGSGKTVVALLAMALAAENGYQSALMAPTEVLAEQHARTLARLIGELPLRVVLLTGRLPAAERRAALAAIESGDADIVVGTQALIQEAVSFHRLGLAVVDEQHRFGVRQRMALAGGAEDSAGPKEPGADSAGGEEQSAGQEEPGSDARGGRGTRKPERNAAGQPPAPREAPDVLVMSATPIPRSLALTLYGDLDLSVLDELPPGRTPVRTALRATDARAGVYDFIRERVAAGRQAYIVYPLVEESEKTDLLAATEEYERLRTEVFPDLSVGLVHGRMPAEEKDAVMRAFADGDIGVLVSTTVIEVGIDVPNATVMLIEHAERFGLSQLHQLRGRVGRGADASYCIVITPEGHEAAERLRIFSGTTDGFEIAREDLRIRGMGDFFGARQHGLPAFRFYAPDRDDHLLQRARAHAREVIEGDPELEDAAHAGFAAVLRERYSERERLYGVG